MAYRRPRKCLQTDSPNSTDSIQLVLPGFTKARNANDTELAVIEKDKPESKFSGSGRVLPGSRRGCGSDVATRFGNDADRGRHGPVRTRRRHATNDSTQARDDTGRGRTRHETTHTENGTPRRGCENLRSASGRAETLTRESRRDSSGPAWGIVCVCRDQELSVLQRQIGTICPHKAVHPPNLASQPLVAHPRLESPPEGHVCATWAKGGDMAAPYQTIHSALGNRLNRPKLAA